MAVYHLVLHTVAAITTLATLPPHRSSLFYCWLFHKYLISSLRTGHPTWWPASPSLLLVAAGPPSICSSSTFCTLRVITKVGNDDWLIISISLQIPSSGCEGSPKRVEGESVFEVLLLPSKYISFSYMFSFPFDWDSWINDRCIGYWIKLPLSIHHHEPEHTSAEWGCNLASWLVRASNTWDNFK